jgi:hypothetical protein
MDRWNALTRDRPGVTPTQRSVLFGLSDGGREIVAIGGR